MVAASGCERTGLGHARDITDERVGENGTVFGVRVLLVGALLPIGLAAAFFGVLQYYLGYLAICVVVIILVTGTDNGGQQVAAGFLVPGMEDAADKSQHLVRTALFKGMRGDVLDLSPNSGFVLFRYYLAPKNKVTSVRTWESNSFLTPLVSKRAAFLSQKYDIKTSVSSEGKLQDFVAAQSPASFDTIVTYGYLNQVADLAASLEALKALLRPGGTIVFLEHDAYPSGIRRTLQNAINWLFKAVSGGFRCNREVLKELEKHFEVRSYNFAASALFPSTNMIAGFASVKKA